MLSHGFVGDVDDERICRGAPFCLKDPCDGIRVERVGTEPIHGLGRKCDEFAAFKPSGGVLDEGWIGLLHRSRTGLREMDWESLPGVALDATPCRKNIGHDELNLVSLKGGADGGIEVCE